MLAAELGIQRGQKQAMLRDISDTAQREDIERQIRDMDLIMLQFADDFTSTVPKTGRKMIIARKMSRGIICMR